MTREEMLEMFRAGENISDIRRKAELDMLKNIRAAYDLYKEEEKKAALERQEKEKRERAVKIKEYEESYLRSLKDFCVALGFTVEETNAVMLKKMRELEELKGDSMKQVISQPKMRSTDEILRDFLKTLN